MLLHETKHRLSAMLMGVTMHVLWRSGNKYPRNFTEYAYLTSPLDIGMFVVCLCL